MEPQFLKQTINIQPEGELKQDNNSPYSFIEWKQRRPYIIEQQAPYHYIQYTVNWFKENKQKIDFDVFLTKQKYLYLLDQLQLFFTETEKTAWYSKINLANKQELLLAIPFFAKKLKNIALYYLNLRKKLKNTKIKYNTVGTGRGLKQEIYNSLLSVLSETKDESNAQFKEYVPELSGLKNTLVVEIEELYDEVDYFDKNSKPKNFQDPNKIFNSLTEKFYNTKGISLSSDDWLFNSLTVLPNSNPEAFINSLTATLLETTDNDLYFQFIEKFLSENKYDSVYIPSSASVDVRSTTIQQGSNVFFYPGSTKDPTVFLTEKVSTIPLSSLSLEGSTGGTSLEDSDTIFVKVGNEVKGAWLKYESHVASMINLEAQFQQNKTTKFIFPYPGYGLSSETFEWTGPNTSNTIQYNFLSNELKSAVNEAYWNSSLDTNNCRSIFLNNTTLAANGANSNINFKFADQVFLQDRGDIRENLPLFEKNGAWLYKFEKAVIPILPNQQDKILWPYELVSQEYPTHFQSYNFNEVCNPVDVSELVLPFGIASNQFKNADKIYKFNSFEDENEQATECCWLSSSLSANNEFYFVEPKGFSSLFESGKATRFLWLGPKTNLNEVFKSFNHNGDCPFVTNIPEVSGLEHTKCTCKQVYYTPLGHPGEKFYENEELADFIVLDFFNGLKSFDKSSWVDLSGNEMIKSSHFAWFKTNRKVGWGDGEWVSGNEAETEPLVLEKGKSYFYFRAKQKYGPNLSSYSVNYNFDDNTKAKYQWVGAILNEDGEWVSSGNISKMKLYPGNLFKYERANSTSFYRITSELVENKGENKGSIWSALDYIVSGSDLYDTTYVYWPTQEDAIYNGGSQAPPFSFGEIESLHWWKFKHLETGNTITIFSEIENISASTLTSYVTGTTRQTSTTPFTATAYAPPRLISTYTNNKMIVSFVPPMTGIYEVSVRATNKNGFTQTFSSIPMLTVVPQFREEELLIQHECPSSGFLLEQPLFGWNYNLNRYDINSEGGKPYWATIYFEKDENTKQKGVHSWGYPNTFLSDYLPDHSPKVSPLELNYGTVVNYQRNGYSFKWTQPIEYQQFKGESRWCKLNVNTGSPTNLSTIFESKNRNDLTVTPTTQNSDILLSNVLNGFPVEITYYALNSFVWNVSVDLLYANRSVIDSKELLFQAQAPWANLGNRYYATVATIPILEELYSEADVGGYFLPQHEGATLYINKNFNPLLNTSLVSANFISEDLDIHVGGFGRTEINQNSVYDSWEENNLWMKESPTAGQIAGNVKNDLTRTLQTFVPYEEANKYSLFGLIDTNTLLNPWSDEEEQRWIDNRNEDQSATGIYNVEHWLKDQVIRNADLHIDCWSSDIFGTQYGIFKSLTACSIYDHKDVLGTLWTRLNDQRLMPASESLASVFKKFKTKSYYNELTGGGIKTIDCFFDTLMIETTGALLFCRLEFNYPTSTFNVNFDNVVSFENLGEDFRYDATWLQTQPKILTILFTEVWNSQFIPILYKMDLANRSFTKEFPEIIEDWDNLQASLSSIQIKSLNRGCLSFNNTKQTYLITYSGIDVVNKLFVIEIEIEQQENFRLTKINRFFEQDEVNSETFVGNPPLVSLTTHGEYKFLKNHLIDIQLNATNQDSSTIWESVGDLPLGCNLSTNGRFTGAIADAGVYFVNYKVTNSVGSIVYPLTLIIT